VFQYSVPHFNGEIKTSAFFFQSVHDPKALFVMAEPFGYQIVQNPFSTMAESSVTQIVPECDGFDQVLI
jgi:hypothetical protein